MKIIKQVDTSNWKYHTTCDKCETELEAEAGDVKHIHYAGDMREPSYDSFHIVCPVCSNQINVSKDKLPKALQIKIKSKTTLTPSPYDR